MERLLVLRLESVGVVAEAWLNGVALARTGPDKRAATVAVNEFTLSGTNRIELIVDPPPPGRNAVSRPLLSNGQRGASLRLLLPRIAQRAHPENARSLAQIDWAPATAEVSTMPLTLSQSVELPIAFPRWGWLDAPMVDLTAELLVSAAAFLQTIALGLARGDAEPLLLAQRLRLEELALAYQRDLADDVGKLRLQVQRLHALGPLTPPMPQADTLLLRPLAGGRLLECLNLDGQAALHSPVAGGRVEWPLRLAVVEGRFYAMR